MRWIVLLLLAGCSPPADVPNLLSVGPRLYRSGQPSDRRVLPTKAWERLASLGISEVIKLNHDSEGLDDEAGHHGIRVHYAPIQPFEQPRDLFAEPDRSTLAEIAGLIRQVQESRKTWLVHCSNGQDRTGLVIGMIRLAMDGWDKRRAWQEMLDRGYHAELLGLDRVWWEHQ
jgi:protein tyrosine/serine phosphatase